MKIIPVIPCLLVDLPLEVAADAVTLPYDLYTDND